MKYSINSTPLRLGARAAVTTGAIAMAYLALAAQPARAEEFGKWRLIQKVDPVTDNRVTVVLAVGVGGAIGLKCDKPGPNSVMAIYMSDTYLGAGPDRVRQLTYRFDADQPVVTSWLYDAKAVMLVKDDEVLAFTARAKRASQLVIRATTYRGDQVTSTFDLAGADQAVARLEADCR